ncbi:MAG: polysaccharide biosynthesis protein [Nitrospirae bacterium]|nr:polysaccharide biosynthesis protein [Nitrospirota bacterium]MBF0539932.1 polysaccharide biosynthesis protein [Nitrospirota bacterium]
MNETKFFEGRTIAITGAAGTIGQELIIQLLKLPVAEVRALDNNESELFFLSKKYWGLKNFQCFYVDIKDESKLNYLLKGVDYLFHAAALKHISICERSPFSTVQNNIIGLQNVIQASILNKIKKVLFTSSDKAVNPTSVMGTSKLMGERLITAANILRASDEDTIFASTRFGNVAGSKGSVIPLFTQQIAKDSHVTLTSNEMTRFMMTLNNAVDLIIKSMMISQGGEVYVSKMPVMRICDLADVMVELLSPVFNRNPLEIEIISIGAQPGEKLYEELINDEEVRRTMESEDMFIIFPALRNIYSNIVYKMEELSLKPINTSYNSSKAKTLNKAEIKEFLLSYNVFPEDLRSKLK